MARMRRQTWKAILAVALAVLVLTLAFSGFLAWYIAVVILLLAMGGGAILYRTLGPPTR
jgi:uncharacterized membrane protein YdbT with pleckstrin-like domain